MRSFHIFNGLVFGIHHILDGLGAMSQRLHLESVIDQLLLGPHGAASFYLGSLLGNVSRLHRHVLALRREVSIAIKLHQSRVCGPLRHDAGIIVLLIFGIADHVCVWACHT